MPAAPPRTLLLLTNQELWPGIICTSHFKPENVILLHGNTPAASKEPACRLQKFLLKANLVQSSELLELPDDDFVGIQKKLDGRCASESVAVGFNGATKLMAVACFDWAMKKGHQALYLETDNEIQRFESTGGKVVCQRENADLSGLSSLNPVETVCSHLHRSEIRIAPTILTLTERGRKLPISNALETMERCIKAGRWDGPALISRDGEEWQPVSAEFEAAGERFELVVALALLKLGIEQIAHSVQLSALASKEENHLHAELDLVFISGGRLWVVECKDHEKIEKKGRRLCDSLRKNARINNLEDDEQDLIDELGGMISRKYKKTLKERILAAQECGGALAEVIFAVRDEPKGDVREFAVLHGIHIARRASLGKDLSRALQGRTGKKQGTWLDELK